MHFRRASGKDAGVLCAVARKTWEQTFTGMSYYTVEIVAGYMETAFSAEKIISEIDEESSEFYLIEVDSRTMGYLKVRQQKGPPCVQCENLLRLERIYLLDTAKGLGLGRKSFHFALNLARQSGFDGIWLGVWEENLTARKFYEKMNCRTRGVMTFHFESCGKKYTDTDIVMTCNVLSHSY